jgi:hypothetical protein
MSWKRRSGSVEKIDVKLEVDVNPPLYSVNEIKTHDFPVKFNIKIQNLPSLFAGKCHALLCRGFDKGRDWYDINWFINKGVEPNYKYLNAMLDQLGPWKGQGVKSDKFWLSNEIINKGNILKYDEVNRDIRDFTNSKIVLIFGKNKITEIVNIFNSNNYGNDINNKNNRKSGGY